MPQCEKYPNGCNGLVRPDSKDKKWYCKRHFYEYAHMKETGRKVTLKEKLIKEEEKKDKEKNP